MTDSPYFIEQTSAPPLGWFGWLGVLALAVAFAAISVAIGSPMIGLGLVGFAVLALAACRMPSVGIVAIAALIPLEAYAWSDLGVRVRAYQLVLVAALLGVLIRTGGPTARLRFPLFAPMAILLAINGLSILNAVSPYDTAVVVGLMLSAYTVYLVGVNAIDRPATAIAVWRTLWIGCVGVALIGLYQTQAITFGWPTLLAKTHLYEGEGYAASFLAREGRPSGTFTEPDLFGAFLSYGLLLGTPLWMTGFGVGARRFWARVGAVVIATALAVSMVRAAWVGLAAGLGVYLYLSARSRLPVVRPLATLLLAALLGLATVAVLNPAALERLPLRLASVVDTGEANAQTRMKTLELLGNRIGDHLLVGHGAGNIHAINKSEENYLLGRVSFNLVLTALYDTGLVGLVALVGFLGSVLCYIDRGLRATHDPKTQALLVACVAALVGLLVSSLFTNIFLRGFLWIHIALSVAVASLAQRTQEGV